MARVHPKAFTDKLIVKGKMFFWIGSLMVSASLSWFLAAISGNIVNLVNTALPAAIMVIGIMLALSFKECQFGHK